MSAQVDKSIRISVVLPSFNGGQYLLPAVRSVLAQTFRDWELILMDDGSTDGSIQNVAALGDDRIRIVSDGTNKGLATRLNEGVMLARGDYIARMDADDLCFPERFEKQLAYLDANPDIDLIGAQIATFKVGEFSLVSSSPINHADICSKPWSGIRLAHPTWMGRTEWFRRFSYHLPEYVRAEDQELLLRAMSTSRYANLPDVLLAYRQGGVNLVKTQKARYSLLIAQLDNFRAVNKKIYAFLSLASYLVKSGIDVLSVLPGMEKLFFSRMGKSVSPELLDKLKNLGVA